MNEEDMNTLRKIVQVHTGVKSVDMTENSIKSNSNWYVNHYYRFSYMGEAYIAYSSYAAHSWTKNLTEYRYHVQFYLDEFEGSQEHGGQFAVKVIPIFLSKSDNCEKSLNPFDLFAMKEFEFLLEFGAII